jgi:biotin synthase
MTSPLASDPAAIAALADAIIAGAPCTAAQGRELLDVVPGSAAQQALWAGAQLIRTHFLGRRLRCCSILNVKAGNCSEDCAYCAQARGVDNGTYDQHAWLPDPDIAEATRSAAANGAQALGIVAAWRGIKEGAQLDLVANAVERLARNGRVRPDVSLGLLASQACADRLKQAGAAVYCHNLETARSFYPRICSTHTFEDRLRTIGFIKRAGIELCCGGIIGMGETKDQRIEFAEQLRQVEPDHCPINFLNPLPCTKLESLPLLAADEALATVAVFRFMLPRTNLMAAGGKEVVLGTRLHELFAVGISGVMVGNYLTSLGTSPEYWQEAAGRYGLEMPTPGAIAAGSAE